MRLAGTGHHSGWNAAVQVIVSVKDKIVAILAIAPTTRPCKSVHAGQGNERQPPYVPPFVFDEMGEIGKESSTRMSGAFCFEVNRC